MPGHNENEILIMRSAQSKSLMESIIASCAKTPVYADIVSEHLSGRPLPLLEYNAISDMMDAMGEEVGLLEKPAMVLKTSGSTGRPKRLFYSQADIERSADAYHALLGQIGINPGMKLWEMSAWVPFISGPLSQAIANRFNTDPDSVLFCPIIDKEDIIKSFRKVSKAGRSFDVVSMPVLFYYILSQVIENPDFLKEIVSKSFNRPLPRPLISLLARIIGRGISPSSIEESIASTRYVISSAAPLDPYKDIITRLFPDAEIIDVWASTENPSMGVRPPGHEGFYLLIENIVPEILPVKEYEESLNNPHHQMITIPMDEWSPGDKGELVISRLGDCLPLLRYRTGDDIEVLKSFEDDPGMGPFMGRPVVRLLGRTAEKLNFFDPEQWGPYHGDEVHYADIEEVLSKVDSIRWWELYSTKELPRRLTLTIIPYKGNALNEKEIVTLLLNNINEATRVFHIAQALGEFDLILLPPESFEGVEKDIEKLVKERGASRVKPRRLFTMGNINEVEEHLHRKYGRQH